MLIAWDSYQDVGFLPAFSVVGVIWCRTKIIIHETLHCRELLHGQRPFVLDFRFRARHILLSHPSDATVHLRFQNNTLHFPLLHDFTPKKIPLP